MSETENKRLKRHKILTKTFEYHAQWPDFIRYSEVATEAALGLIESNMPLPNKFIEKLEAIFEYHGRYPEDIKHSRIASKAAQALFKAEAIMKL